MAKPLIAYDLVHTFDDATLLPRESFAVAGVEYAGAQPSSWESSEESWDEGDPVSGEQTASERGIGGWEGPGVLHSGPGEMWLDGATTEDGGYDDIARLATGNSVVATWSMIERGWILPHAGTQRFLLQNTANGVIALNASVAVGVETLDITALLGASLLDGKYALWGRVEGGVAQWQLPPDYYEITGFEDFDDIPDNFKFIENNELKVWDYIRDVGARPVNREQLAIDGTHMYAAYYAAELNHELQRRGEWTRYITSGSPQNGPWSALRFVVGESDWEAAAGVLPAIGPSLLSLDDEATSTPVAFDAMASSVSAWAKMKRGEAAGEFRLGGTIATRNGPAIAYWHFHPGESTPATLLATSERVFVAMCEASLHATVSDILEQRMPPGGSPDGTRREMVLTFGHLKEYVPEKASVQERLPGLPRSTFGHPGGRVLRQVGDQVVLLTESFEDPPSGELNFYNRVHQLSDRGRVSGPGTAFHSHNAADVVWGGYYGIRQDAPFGSDDAQQFIAYIENRQWITAGMESFPAAAYRWQRVRALSHPKGLRLYVSGKQAVGENAIWGIADGVEFREGVLNFRPRRITRVEDDNGNEQLYAIGRFVENGLVATQWSIIKLPGANSRSGFVEAEFWWNDVEQEYCMARAVAEASGVDVAKMWLYLVWQEDALSDGGGWWRGQNEAPAPGSIYLELVTTVDSVCYAVGEGVVLPYDPTVWEVLIIVVLEDGSLSNVGAVETGATNAAEALALMPVGTKPLYENKALENGPWFSIRLLDMNDVEEVSRLRTLASLARFYPMSWMQPPDSDDVEDDLTSYTIRVPFNRAVSLSREANARLRWVGLIPPDTDPVLAPVVTRKN